ncbi:MAG: hypothetical protein K0R51_1877 [Cytophagaceae bacterium]|jgi:integral membrane protein|nr:hypothetical protein [Cytophagaceae bacterium]
MLKILTTPLGRLRLLAFLEGISLILLLFVAVPIKYYAHNPAWVKAIGPIHGMLFLLFIVNTISFGVAQHWSFKKVTWKVLLACIIPFGTFYIDWKILSRLKEE